ncbi:MAG: ATP-grasp domain-containing protein [Deltaproteobacteria bacterium]|nr:ATP-grasp domain-containing protein [Deltaproteobacteria bacterium]
MPAPIRKVLVANRGEIARRVLRTVRAMGLASVAVYSDADAGAPHVAEADEAVRIGPAPSRESYLAIDRILEAARATGADAIHPGYGFLSENAEFAARVAEAGRVFVGPPVEAIRRMGSKIAAKEIMAAAGVPVVPGASLAELPLKESLAAARGIGFPILIKASAGGGGKGMRIVREEAAFTDAIATARREAENAFGDGTLLIERYFDAPRHVEIQIFGDPHGNVVHLGERECSIQRRYQKIIEEAPSPAVDTELRTRMGEAAVAAARAIGYVGAGTVEFILDQEGAFYFLEVNTRLQVEHPVTEAVTGLDLVRWQILVAAGAPLPLVQADVGLRGHAIEARLYAEDPAGDFLPATGAVALWQPLDLPGVRYDSGVESGSEVGVHYDPLLAKIIAHAPTRAEATRLLRRALAGLGVGPITTNRDFLLAVLDHEAFGVGALHTHFIEQHLPPAARRTPRTPAHDRIHAIAAALWEHARRRRAGGPLPESLPSGWRNSRWRAQDAAYLVGGEPVEVRYVAEPGDRFVLEGDPPASALVHAVDGRGIAVEIDGVRRRFAVVACDDALVVHGPLGTAALVPVPRFPPAEREDLAGGCLAPMTGIIREVRVSEGDEVEKGTVLLVLEAMKMEHQMIARDVGVVKQVRVEVGQMVDPDEVLVVVEPRES